MVQPLCCPLFRLGGWPLKPELGGSPLADLGEQGLNWEEVQHVALCTGRPRGLSRYKDVLISLCDCGSGELRAQILRVSLTPIWAPFGRATQTEGAFSMSAQFRLVVAWASSSRRREKRDSGSPSKWQRHGGTVLARFGVWRVQGRLCTNCAHPSLKPWRHTLLCKGETCGPWLRCSLVTERP